jgi:hypothetical protein
MIKLAELYIKTIIKSLIKDIINNYNDLPKFYKLLVELRNTIFPPDEDPILDPEKFDPYFVNEFLGDEQMWDFIIDANERNASENIDSEAASYILEDLKEIYKANRIFAPEKELEQNILVE